MAFLVLVLILFSILLLCFGAIPIIRYRKSEAWQKVDAKIISISESFKEVSSSEYQKIKYYYPIIEYEYNFGGTIYTSSQVSFDIKNVWVPEVDNCGAVSEKNVYFWRAWESGSIVNAFVNPSNPSQSCLIIDLSNSRKSHYLSLIVSGLLVLVVGVVVALKL